MVSPRPLRRGSVPLAPWKGVAASSFVALVVACGSVAAPDGFTNEPGAPRPPSPGTCYLECTSVVDVTVPALSSSEAAAIVIVGCVDETCVERRLPKPLADRGQCEGASPLSAFGCAYRVEAGSVRLALQFSSRGIDIVPSTLFTTRLEREGDRALLFGAGPAAVARSKSQGCGETTCWSGTLALAPSDAGPSDAGPSDAGSPDTGPSDASPEGGGPLDAAID